MIEVGFLGIGQGGNNAVETASAFNYPCAIMNTSLGDLNAVKLIQQKDKYLIGSRGGCGKNRKTAISEVKLHHKGIIQFVKEKFVLNAKVAIKIVFVVFTGGGGTGSGMGPIITDLLNKSINGILFIPIILGPDFTESEGALKNTILATKEIAAQSIPFTIISNEKARKLHPNFTRKELFNFVNRELIKELNQIFKTERTETKTGNFDKQDFTTVINTAGMFLIHRTNLFLKEEKNEVLYADMMKEVINDLDTSIYADLPYDKAVGYLGFLYTIPERKQTEIKYDEVRNILGFPKEIFEGIYDFDEEKDEPNVVTIISGLSLPITQINEMADIINGNMGERKRRNVSLDIDLLEDDDDDLNVKKEVTFSSILDEPDEFEGSDGEDVIEEEDVDLGDFFAQYE